MRAVADRLFPATEWSSIDEFYADTTDLQTRHPDPRSLARLVKQSILDATGLTCTVAVATGKTVAKIAADASKPDGLAIIEPGQEAVFLRGLPPRALPGIGPKTAARLEPFGITSIAALLDPQWDRTLSRLLGSRLPWIRALAQGQDHEPVVADRETKSTSHETTFEHDTADASFLGEILRGYLRTLARDLRHEGLAAGACTVKLKDARFVITTRQRQFPHPLNYDPEMWPIVRQALHDAMKPQRSYRLAGLALSSLVPVPPGLYDQQRSEAVKAMDAIIARHGAVIGLGGVPHDDE
jgi:DNA polymerase-4